MIKAFLLEKRSWIAFFIFLQLLILFIAFLDITIPIKSMLYIVFLSTIFFSVFLLIRYQLETAFYRSLNNWEQDLDLGEISAARSPFELIVRKSLIEQSDKLKQTLSMNQIRLEQERDDAVSWIHEVKTPLTAMKLMIDHLDDPTQRSKLTYEWLRIHMLLDQQLHQARIPFIENDLYVEQVNIEDLIFQEIKTLQSWCIEKGIGFDLNLDVRTAISDAKWLAFILRQLLTNAVKYSNATDIIISTYLRDGYTFLEVADSGCGIAPRDLPRIFDKMFTSTTARQNGGATGMGLYLAKKAADSLHIKIDVESKFEKGTTFKLTFPKRNEFNFIRSM